MLFPSLLKKMKILKGQRRNGLSKNALLDDRFSARRLEDYSLTQHGPPPKLQKIRKIQKILKNTFL